MVALMNRIFAPIKRFGNTIWTVVIVLLLLLPFVSMGYELGRTTIISAIVFAALIVTWFAVMILAWRKRPTSTNTDQKPANKA